MKTDRFVIEFSQDVDGDESQDDICQELSIEITDCGGGSYFVLKTRRWAVDAPADMAELMAKVQQAFETAGGSMEIEP